MKWIDYEALKKMINDQRMTGPETIHGLDHWEQVEHNGLLLAKKTGADPTIIKLFALFHDSRRIDDGYDPEHGPRAALFLDSCRGQYFELEEKKYNLLKHACHYHTKEHASDNISINTCYDADRLDLARAGYRSDPKKMATDLGAKLAEASREVPLSEIRAWLKSKAKDIL